MSYQKSAKTLSDAQIRAVLNYLSEGRHAPRNRVIFLLSVRAGLRAKEIADLTWEMVLNSDGEIGESIHLTDVASKGRSGRVIPLNKELRKELIAYRQVIMKRQSTNRHHSWVIHTDRSPKTTSQTIINMFRSWYTKLGFFGCSSHSGRRTFITRSARKISTVGGSLRDVQYLAGHSNLQTTQRYIDYDTDSQKRIVDLI